jgi:hypothetical protein
MSSVKCSIWEKCDIKINRSKLAKILGLRQIGQIDRYSEVRIKIVSFILSTMSSKAIEKQTEIGKNFICGYRPGIIPNNEIFNSAAENSRLSPVYLDFARQVLVNGATISSLSANGSEKLAVDQACITLCRRLASIDTYRSQTVRDAIAHLDQFAVEGSTYNGVHLFASLTNTPLKTVNSWINNEIIPDFSSCAYHSILLHLPRKDVVSLYKLFDDTAALIKTVDEDCWLESSSGLNHKIKLISGNDSFKYNEFYKPNMDSGSRFPDILMIRNVYDKLSEFLNFATSRDKNDFSFEYNTGIFGSFVLLKKLIDCGESLFYLSKVYGEEHNKTKIALYNRYTRKFGKLS